MSGLESIALAVAHLEELQQKPEEQKSIKIPTLSSDERQPIAPHQHEHLVQTLATPPAPQPFASATTVRIVSSDSLASSSHDHDQVHVRHSGEASSSAAPYSRLTKNIESTTFANVVADPAAWLERTERLTAAAPPGEVVNQVIQDDVLCGRGGETNHHQGNIQYRTLVKAFQPLYIASKRRDKPRIAKCIVYTIRKQGGRFLKRTDPRSNTWTDVGNTKAREKTSQALREGAPELRGTEKTSTGTTSAPPAMLNLAPLHRPPLSPRRGLPQSAFTPQQLYAQHLHNQRAAAAAAVAAAVLTPLQQAMSRTFLATATSAPPAVVCSIPVVTPISPSFAATKTTASRKRTAGSSVATISDADSSDNISQGSNGSATSAGRQGPRLKRLKQRLEESSSSTEDAAVVVVSS